MSVNGTSDPGCEATQERRALWSSSPKLRLVSRPRPSTSPCSPATRLPDMSIPSTSQVSVGVGWPKTCQKALSVNLIPLDKVKELPIQVFKQLQTHKRKIAKYTSTVIMTISLTLQRAIPLPCTSSCFFKGLSPFMKREGLSRSEDDNCDRSS